jgi:O-antigen/teichoic acid export membrane protein
MKTLRDLLRKPMVARIIASTGSNAYAQATTIGIQLLSLPLFLSRWDVTTYGHWLILSAVPSYLAMADAGMITAAGNRMTMLIGEGDTRAANRMFQSALAFMLGVCALVMLLVAAALALWPFDAADARQSIPTIAILAATVAVTLFGGLPEAVYKATHRYALGAALANTVRLFEWIGGLVGLWWCGDFVAVALGALLPRAAFTAAMAWHAAFTTPDFEWGFADASVSEIRGCAGPAIAFMAFPAANALNFQGMTLVAASVLGPAATVVFNTYRTMARVTVQATATFSHALWPEFSRLYGQRDFAGLGALYRRSTWLGIALALVASAVVYLAAPTVLAHWSRGQIDFVPTLMFASMAYAAVAGGWHVSRILLLSTNEHGALAWQFLAASALCVPIAWVMARSFGLIGIVFAMLGLELAMLLLCSYLSRRLMAPSRGVETVSVAT